MSGSSDFLFGGSPAAKFPHPGSVVAGKIVKPAEQVQIKDFDSGELLTWKDGSPRMQLVVTLQTDLNEEQDDDGVRRIFVSSKLMRQAIALAVKRGGASDLEVGGTLALTYIRDGVKDRPGGFPPKEYAAVYTRPEAGSAVTESNDSPATKIDLPPGMDPDAEAALRALINKAGL